MEVNEPSNEKLLEWNKEEIGLFEENKVKPSSISSPTTQDYTSKRQSRKTSRSIKETITSNVGGANSQDDSLALFKPNININPLLETGSGTNLEETKNTDSLYAQPDPEIVKKKSEKRMASKGDSDNATTAIVNEFFDEEDPDDGVEVPPKMYNDDDANINDKTNDDETDKPSNETNKPSDATNKLSDKKDDTTDTQTPINDDTAATEDKATEETVKPPPTDTNEVIMTDEAEKEASAMQKETATDQPSKESDQTSKEPEQTGTEDQTTTTTDEQPDEEDNTVISTAANTPLIKVAQSKPPSSPGKYGLKVRHYMLYK